MATISDIGTNANDSGTVDLYQLGFDAARAIADDHLEASSIEDPGEPRFAEGVIEGLTAALHSSPGVIRRMVKGASAAAEDLNVEPFHGIVEVMQNADDLGARNLRIALVGQGAALQLLIVHDGDPVTCHHVLGMALPYLTNKTNDADLRGRFGIGLKTLRRISSRIGIHSAPYHFTAQGVDITIESAAAAIPSFYDPGVDTLLVLDLFDDFAPAALETWFADWNEESLLFLRSVSRFSWIDLDTGAADERTLDAGSWSAIEHDLASGTRLDRRLMKSVVGSWSVFRATFPRPLGIDRSHKATADTTAVSIALPSHDHTGGLFIGFRTRIPLSVPFSIDAQFDPSAARDALIDNPWNRWLIAQCGAAVSLIVRHLLITTPAAAWPFAPTIGESIGPPNDRWPTVDFEAAFAGARENIATAEIIVAGQTVAVRCLAYESVGLTGFLTADDIRLLKPGSIPLTGAERDANGRWRRVLKDVGGSAEVGAAELAAGFRDDLFVERNTDWWIDAGDRLTAQPVAGGLFGVPCWMTDQGKPAAVVAKGATARKLVIGDPLSDFALRWSLFDRLHERYQHCAAGERAKSWLEASASVTSLVEAEDELKAFAEIYAEQPFAITDPDLRTLRDRFDLVGDRRAELFGESVGAALLLDGFVHRGTKKVEIKIQPNKAYLTRTIDKEHPYWPEAARGLPDIAWLAPSYDERLKTGATRTSRKRADGTISRGARKFLVLLGAGVTPRTVAVGRRDGGSGLRRAALYSKGADYVKADHISPDLQRVLAAIGKMPKKDRKVRSAALLKALARYWGDYVPKMTTRAYRTPYSVERDKGEIESDWLCRLRETAWVAIGTGDLTTPEHAVVRNSQTQTLYGAKSFIAGIGPDDLRGAMPSALKINFDVRATDLVGKLEQLRDDHAQLDSDHPGQLYRALARISPTNVSWNSKVGDMALSSLRERFERSPGLVFVPNAKTNGGRWCRPSELFSGSDIFHAPERFVPGGSSYSPLWTVLNVRRPSLDDCFGRLKELAGTDYSTATEAVLIDVYTYVEGRLGQVDRLPREKLRALPLYTSNGWSSARPVFHVRDRELRRQLSLSRPDLTFWIPPRDTTTLPQLTSLLGLTLVEPELSVGEHPAARLAGEGYAPHFQRCVDHLSNELARHDAVTRNRISIPWAQLRELPLAVYDGPFEARAIDESLSNRPVVIQSQAVLERNSPLLSVSAEAFQMRDQCGRVIASLFPTDARHHIEAEWVVSWMTSFGAPVERMTMASDEDHARALAEQAAAAVIAPSAKINITPPASRATKAAPPRRLKEAHGGIASVEIINGSPPTPAPPPQPLAPSAPSSPPSPPTPTAMGPLEYNNQDLEQRGWEILRSVLVSSTEGEIVDFRRTHRIGADGVIDWEKFVELKATAGPPQSSVELSATEFERAKEQGLNFMLALVSGLEDGFTTEVRIILDPANRASIRPVGSVRLVNLMNVAAVRHVISDFD
jgi:hypothetical protein